VSAIVDAAANALFPAFSRISSDAERLRNSYVSALGSVTLFAVVISGFLISFGEPAVVVLLGEPWRAAGAAVVAMAGLGLGKAFTCVSEEAIKGSGRTKLLHWMTGLEFGVGIASLVLIIPFGLFGVGLAISITAMVVGLAGLHLCRTAVGVSYAQIIRVVLPPIVAGVAAVITVGALEHAVLHSDTHGTLIGLGLLVLDSLLFLVVYVAALAVVARPMLHAIVLPLVTTKLRRRSSG
jgi:O-antigen/teichoic acid export membrane protein